MIDLTAREEHRGRRLDQFLQDSLPQYSRARLQEWIRGGRVRVDGEARKPAFPLTPGAVIRVDPADRAPLAAAPEAIPLDILYEDEHIVAVNKPAGMVVHAGAGVGSGTLVNAALHRFGELSQGSEQLRPGIVHRLDRDTSGVILIARTDRAHRALAEQFAARRVEKVYVALVERVVTPAAGRIDKPIARDPVHRTRMTARLATGRAALTQYVTLERFRRHTLLEVRIGTGRTHQIRVHLASLGHPVAGDRLYGGAAHPSGRFFLHARSIAFSPPAGGALQRIEAPLPPELEQWLADLRSSE